MAAHLLKVSGVGCNAFLGGVLRNYNTNYLLDETSPYAVIEADEYDRSFHHLHPSVAVVTSTDPDHLDIYGTEEAYLESFARFTELIGSGRSPADAHRTEDAAACRRRRACLYLWRCRR